MTSMMDSVNDLVTWLTGCYDRAEQQAQAAVDAVAPHGRGPIWPDVRAYTDEEADALDAFIGTVTPAWRLADIARKRQILAEHQPVQATSERRWSSGLSCVICDHGFPDYPCKTVRLLAEEFAGEPGYREEWRPEQTERRWAKTDCVACQLGECAGHPFSEAYPNGIPEEGP